MSKLPDGWKLVKLKDVIHECTERVGNLADDIPVLSVTNSSGFRPSEEYFSKQVFSMNISNYKVVRKTQFAYNPSRVNVGSIDMLTDFETGALSPMYVVYGVNKNKLLPEYMRYWTMTDSFLNLVKSKTQGTVRSSLSYKSLAAFPFLLPPIEEQREIVGILRSLDDTIRKTDQLILNMMRQKYDFIDNFFSSTVISGKSPQYKWKKVRLKEIIVDTQGGISPKCEARKAENNEWGVLKLSAVSLGIFDQNENKALPDEVVSSSLSRYEVKTGDLLITRSNTPELVGMVCLVKETRPRLLLSDLIWRIDLDEKDVSPDFLNHYLKSSLSRQQIVKAASGTSGSMKKLSIARLKNIFVPLPPLKIQNEISSLGESFDNRIAAERAYLAQLRETRKAIAQALLSGRARLNT